MRGIVFTADGVEITDDLSVRDPGPKEVKVRIVAAGVCHSDLSVIDGTIPFPPPVVLGPEGADLPGLQHRAPHVVSAFAREHRHPIHLQR
jgi:S-(hydroxymethyl)glutathione dehydrogenase/alcohol dehydrogenase